MIELIFMKAGKMKGISHLQEKNNKRTTREQQENNKRKRNDNQLLVSKESQLGTQKPTCLSRVHATLIVTRYH